MKIAQDIMDYQGGLSEDEAEIGAAIIKLISKALPKAEGKVWHGHPVWFLDGNPVVGYSLKKSGIEVLFWSGQSFKNAGLLPLGKFKAAKLEVASLKSLDKKQLAAWLVEAEKIQWDYANLPKKRALEKLTKF
jgi:hypothetical protein